MKKLEKIVGKITEGVCWVGSAVALIMMLFMVADIILRYIFKSPFKGDYELIELAMVVLVFTVIPHTQTVKGHVAVDIVTNYLPKKVRDIFSVITSALSIVLLVLVDKANYQQIIKIYTAGTTTGTLKIPMWPFYALVFFCLCLYTLTIVVNLLVDASDLFSKRKKE